MDGRQHQAWELDDKKFGLILTMDTIPNYYVPSFWGLYTQNKYYEKIKNNEFIQDNLSPGHIDYNYEYHKLKYKKSS